MLFVTSSHVSPASFRVMRLWHNCNPSTDKTSPHNLIFPESLVLPVLMYCSAKRMTLKASVRSMSSRHLMWRLPSVSVLLGLLKTWLALASKTRKTETKVSLLRIFSVQYFESWMLVCDWGVTPSWHSAALLLQIMWNEREWQPHPWMLGFYFSRLAAELGSKCPPVLLHPCQVSVPRRVCRIFGITPKFSIDTDYFFSSV